MNTQSGEVTKAPRASGASYRGFRASLVPSNCFKTAKLRRLDRWQKLVASFSNNKTINFKTFLTTLVLDKCRALTNIIAV